MIALLALLACPPKPAPLPDIPVTTTPVTPTPTAVTPTTPTPSEPGTSLTPEVAPPVPAGPSPTDLAIHDAAILLNTPNANNAQIALDKLKIAAQDNPSNPVIQYNIGLAYYQLGRYSEARDSWVRTTSLDPSFVKAWLNLGSLSAHDGKMDVALLNYQSGIAHAPDNPELRAAQIAALRELKRNDEAIAEAKKALAINSNALPVYTNLALVYLDTDKVDLALFVVDKARQDVQGADQDPQMHAILGQIYYRLGYPVNAVQEFKRALELNPTLLPALMFMSGYYMDNRAYADAVPLLERAAGIAPSSAGVQLNLGIAYRGLGRYEEAKRCYDRALQLDPRDPEPHRNLAILYGDHLHSLDAALAELDLYRKGGGGPADQLDAWQKAIEKEKERKAKEEARRKRDEERARKEAEEAAKAALPPPAPEGVVVPPGPAPDPSQPPGGAMPQPYPPGGATPQPYPSQPYPPGGASPVQPQPYPSQPYPPSPSEPTAPPTQPAPTQPVQPQPYPAQPYPADPNQPVQPAPAQPDPNQPAPVQPVQPGQTDPNQPAPAQPAPAQPAPAQPAPAQPAPTDPSAPANPWGSPAPTPPAEPSPWGGGG